MKREGSGQREGQRERVRPAGYIKIQMDLDGSVVASQNRISSYPWAMFSSVTFKSRGTSKTLNTEMKDSQTKQGHKE